MFSFFPRDGQITASLSPLELATLNLVADDEETRTRKMRQSWDAYFGRMDKPLKITRTDPKGNDNTIVPYTRLICDTVVSWLFGHEPVFNLDDQRTRNPQEAWLDEVWAANRKMISLQKLGLNGAVTGHAYLRLQRSSPITGNLPRLIVLDPETVRVCWSDDDIDLVESYCLQWNVANTGDGRPGVRRQTITPDDVQKPSRWTILDEVADLRAQTWRTLDTETWPYSFAPIVDTQHLPAPNVYYGISELEDAIVALNDALNFAFSNTNRIIRLHGHPKVWARGMGDGDIDLGPDDVLLMPSDAAELKSLEMQSDLASGYGHSDRLLEALLTVSRVPLLAIGEIKGVREISGTALQVLFRPLLQKCETLRLTYGAMLDETNRRLLLIGNKGEASPSIQWPEMLPGDPLEERQTAVIDQQLGVSRDTILTKLGYDPDREAQQKAAEDDLALEQQARAFDRGAQMQPPPAPPPPRQTTRDVQRDPQGRIARIVEMQQ